LTSTEVVPSVVVRVFFVPSSAEHAASASAMADVTKSQCNECFETGTLKAYLRLCVVQRVDHARRFGSPFG
jgi:hypothetical protein